ncbi:MAG: NAD(P)-dependent oxidoreductase [Marmoricola sp.]
MSTTPRRVSRVGFVGLGNIGRPMALRLAGAGAAEGLKTVVYDVAPEPLAELEEAGAVAAAGVGGLAADVDLVCVMVRDDDQVREVLGQVLGAARPGTVVAIHSTVAPGTPSQLADVARRHDLAVVDAPVSGGAMGAANGSLAIMVGGSVAEFEACRPALSVMGSTVVHAGPTGAGTTMKLARNLLHFVSFTAGAEAQRLAEASGIDLVALGEVVRRTDAVTGGPGAIMHRDTTAPLTPDDPWYPIFEHVRALGEKDLGFAVDLAGTLDVDVPLARLALESLADGLGLRARGEGS